MSNDEWQTPDRVLDAVRGYLGEIDLDPASSSDANKRVGAARYFDKETNGLAQQWKGRVFLNPPYSRPLCEQFIQKAVDQYYLDHCSKMVILTNAAMDTRWAQLLLNSASGVCFTRGRIAFIDPATGAPARNNRCGQCFWFFAGKFGDKFKALEHFQDFGRLVWL